MIVAKLNRFAVVAGFEDILLERGIHHRFILPDTRAAFLRQPVAGLYLEPEGIGGALERIRLFKSQVSQCLGPVREEITAFLCLIFLYQFIPYLIKRPGVLWLDIGHFDDMETEG